MAESVDRLKKRRDVLSDYLRDLLAEVKEVTEAIEHLNGKITENSPLLTDKRNV